MGERFRTSSPDLGLGFASRSSELSIVLCCNDQWKKCSVVNTILGRTQVTPNPKIKTEGEVEDRHVVFVSSPDWTEYSSQNHWKHVKQHIEESVSACPAGPHAFLMVIPLHSFREAERREVEERLELFYECIWRCSIVLFSGKDGLGGKTVEKFIEEEPCLQQLIQKCGNRYHVLTTENREELLETIDVMVTENDCPHFQMMEASKAIEEKKAVLEENAKQRLVMVQEKRETLRQIINEAARDFSDITMVLLGRFCAGKCSTGNNILGKTAFDTTINTSECVKKEGEVNGRKVTVVLTPGWHRDFSGQEGTQNIKDRIKQSESLCPSKPHAFLLVIHCDSSFTETDRRRVEEHLSVLGEEACERTLVLFTWGDKLGETTIEMHIERWNELRWLVDKCGNRYHVLDNKSTDRSQVGELLEKVDEMLAERKCTIRICQETQKKNRELKEINQEQDREVKQLKEELEQKCQEIRSLDDNREREISHLKDELRKMEMEAHRQLYSEEPRQDGQGYLKPGLAILGAVIGGIAGALRGPGGVAGGTTLGAVVGAQLGDIFGGGDRPREKRGRERRMSMDDPGGNF
ncbi:hypothetical protein SKAU_G00241650 [Synaphobranchus kaupii]|uniref:AIG1-type G domain-containing protein n=1 Tax=Synaphobranchus kaupii TaxID=118154 RepID=A0A9Q1IUA3_SYNKA|nr:hypothetical protein SKAU_G00241650 [Synaphobranchus kaupii]